MRIVIACAALLLSGAYAQAQRSLFDQTPADPSAGFSPAPAQPAPAAPSPAQVAPAAPATSVQAGATAPSGATAAPAEAAAPTPKPKPKRRGPQPARAVTVINGTAVTVSSLEITGGNKTVRWTKPIASQAKAVVKMPALKDCTVTVLATYEGEGAGTPGEVDICKEKTIRLTE